MSTERLAAAALLVVATGALVATIAPRTLSAQATSTAPTLDAQRAELEALERLVELATGPGFYLVLDPDAAEVRLMFGGAVLQQFPVASLEVGHARLAFCRVGTVPSWSSTIWRQGTLAPPRRIESVVLKPLAGAAAEEEPAIVPPPTAEEAIPAPRRYLIRFAGGLAVEIDSPDDSSEGSLATRLRNLRNRWDDVRAIMSDGQRDLVRVRLVLDKDVADALYRSVPEDIGLLVVLAPPVG